MALFQVQPSQLESPLGDSRRDERAWNEFAGRRSDILHFLSLSVNRARFFQMFCIPVLYSFRFGQFKEKIRVLQTIVQT